MKILGVDPGLNITGYGVVNGTGGGYRLVEAGVVRTDRADSIDLRLKRIYDGLSEVIEKHRPDVLVLEKLYAHYRHPVTALLMGHARGVACLLCGVYGIPLISYASTRIKKATVGNGRAGKEQVAKMVANLLGIKEIPEYYDVTDALAVAICHIRVAKKLKVQSSNSTLLKNQAATPSSFFIRRDFKP